MNNYELKNLIGSIFGWHQRKAVVEKIGYNPYYQSYGKLERPINYQVMGPSTRPIRITIKKQND